jgi:putative aldouronate transport system permease protein
MTSRYGNRYVTFAIYFVLALTALLALLPIWHVVALSLSRSGAAVGGFVSFWPVGFSLEAYRFIVKDPQFLRAFLVSVERVFIGGGLNMLLTIMMAYPLSRHAREFPARNVYMWFLIFMLLFSGGLIPLYMLLRQLQLLDTLWSLVLPGAVPVFNVILLMNFFRALPKELEEAAIMDGAGPLRLLWSVYLPLSLPALATIALFSIVGHWNSFFDGLVYMNSPENYPLQTYIQQLVVKIDLLNNPNATEILRAKKIDQLTLNAAKLIVTMLPILLIYPLLQRYFIHGIVLGSVKE